jgi:hypothetical protein
VKLAMPPRVMTAACGVVASLPKMEA